MITFTKELAIQVVKKTLHIIADFSDSADITQFSFQHFNNYHKAAFMAGLKQQILNLKGDDYYYDVPLNPDDINGWQTVNDCIDFLLTYISKFPAQTGSLSL